MLPVAIQEDWTTYLVALGTLLGALAGIGIAIFASRESRKQLTAEHQFGYLQLEGERTLAADREQLAEAALVEVTPAERTVVLDIDDRAVGPAGAVRKQLGLKLVNNGHYTISAIEAKFSLVGIDGLFPAADYVLTDDGPVDFPETSGGAWQVRRDEWERKLPPWNVSMFITSAEFTPESVNSAYVIVRWTGRWGDRWEYRHGRIHKMVSDAGGWDA